MCYRFVRESKLIDVAEEFSVDDIDTDLQPSYNVAPTQDIPAIIHDGTRRIVLRRWGLVPPWARDISIGNKLLNARAETITEKPSFRLAFKKRRCLIPANGYYEWRKEEKRKIPVYVRLKSEELFVMAGLWERWTSPEGKQVSSCTIITIASNDWLKPVNDRMPVIIPKDRVSGWLDAAVHSEEFLLPMLQPYDADSMEAHDVSTIVNSPKNNSPENIKPV